MKRWRNLSAGVMLALVPLTFFVVGLSLTAASPGALEPGGVLVPLGTDQADVRAAYAEALDHLYDAGRLHRLAAATSLPTQPGDLYVPPGEVVTETFCAACSRQVLSGTAPLTRAYALRPGRVALFRSSVTYTLGSEGEGEAVAMWEYAHVRELFDGYLRHAVPYATLDEDGVTTDLAGYDLLILPAFNADYTDAVLDTLDATGGLDALAAFVDQGGTLYAQGAGLHIAQAAGVLPGGTVDPTARVTLWEGEGITNRGYLYVTAPDSPLAWRWRTQTLYVLDDPLLHTDEGVEVIAEFTNAENDEGVPAVIRADHGRGQVLGVAGHPTDPLRRDQAPIFINALLQACAGYLDVYGDAVQTFNPAYPPHEFPAYEEVPVSATVHVENLWDTSLGEVVVTETLAPGYLLTGTIAPAPAFTATTPDGSTRIVWSFEGLAAHEALTLSYQAVTSPTVLAAGISTFARGEVAYRGVEGEPLVATHRPFVLRSQMAARLVGDRDLEADRHYRIPAEGIYLDMALPLENKEQTPATNVTVRDWIILLAPFVDVNNQHVILNANDGETIWMRHEAYLWGDKYPLWDGATASTQTLTLDDWQGDRCLFTSTYGIHTDPPAIQLGEVVTDYGSFITIPPTYTDYISVTTDDELLLPCLPITWAVGALNGYEYRDPFIRYGIHSRELFSRTVVFHGTPREGTVVLPYDAGSVYVAAGSHPVPYRQYVAHAEAYVPQAPAAPRVTWQDVWSRTHTLPLRGTFYDVWDWDSCATCGVESEQHVGFAVTFGIWIDTDGDGVPDRRVKEIPTRLSEAQLRLLGKTYSVNAGDYDFVVPTAENVIDLPVFKGLGVKIGPEGATWYDSWRDVGPGSTDLISVSEQTAYDHLFFQQEIPPGSWASFVVSATIENYSFNREGLFKLHDGGRLVYRQPIAGPNRYEVYDARVQAAEGWRSDAEVEKRGGPTLVSIYSDTLLFDYHVTEPYEPRSGWAFEREYDPYLKSWGYDDLVWTTYVGGSEKKTLFRTVLQQGDRTRLRISVDNNTGITLTDLSVIPQPPPGITATLLYTDPATAPEPIWPELSFLNRTDVPDAWRSVWYFELEVGDVDPALWDTLLEIPIAVSATGLPEEYTAPPARVYLRQETEPTFVSAPAHDLVLTDTLPSNVALDAALLITDAAVLDDLWTALDADAGNLADDTAGALFDTLAPTHALTIGMVVSDGLVTFDLPAAQQIVPADADWHVVAKATLLRAHHGTNVVNAGASIGYTDPFSLTWHDQGTPVVVEAHGAAVWVDYECEGGYEPSSYPASDHVLSEEDGTCTIPDYGPAEVVMDVTAYNAGDAIARTVTVTLVLPQGVTITESIPPWLDLTDGSVTWSIGDLAPGAWKELTIIFRVEPDEGEWEGKLGEMSIAAVDSPGRLLGVRRTDGAFVDEYSDQPVSGQFAGPFWFNVWAAPSYVYLPVIMRTYDARPDLWVQDLSVDPANPAALTVTLANTGEGTARDFWVDLYLDPETPPEVNQPWTELCYPYGAAWFVDALSPGETLTLTIDGAHYQADQSRWPVAYPAGEHEVWTYTDSWGYPQPWGGIRETDESNNRYGPVTFSVSETLSDEEPERTFEPIPSRPRYPEGGER